MGTEPNRVGAELVPALPSEPETRKGRLRRFSWLPIPLLLALILALYWTVNPALSYDPGWLILVGNTLFITVISLVVCWIAAKNYGATGRLQILLLGCGVLIFGIGGALAAIVRPWPDGANLNVTIYNTGALLGGTLHFAAAFVLLSGAAPEAGARQKRALLILGYAGCMLFMAALTAASLRGLTPPFQVAGQLGFTPIRQFVLGGADILFVFSAVVFLGTYLRNKEVFLYWYACALACTAISLTAFFIQSSVGSPVGWVGRFSQYVGGVYFLISLVAAARSARIRRTSLDNVLTASLSGAEEPFRVMVENAQEGIVVGSPDQKLLFVNQRMAEMLGYTRDEVVSKTLLEFMPESERGAVVAARQSVAQGESFRGEFTFRRKDGSTLWTSSSVSPIYDSAGRHVRNIALHDDITERKRTEEALRLSEEKFAAAFANNPAAIALTGLEDGLFLDVNDTWVAMNGYSREEAIGHSARQLHIWPTDEAAKRFVGELTQKGILHGREQEFLKKSGELFIAQLSAQVLDIRGEKVILSTLVDITDRKRAEKDLRELNAELERRVAERTAEVRQQADQLRALANGLSQTEQHERQRLARILHDNIQQLLVAAQMQLSLIKHGDPKLIRSAAQGVDSILAETLEASRSLTVELCPPVLHQSGLVAALTWLAARMEEKQQFRVHVRATNDAEPATPEVRAFLFEAARELLLNVVKHSGAREADMTMVRTRDECCRIIVEDKGRGFDPAAIKPGPSGGFGLFSIQQRLLHMGGKVEIESATGLGTKAVLSIPIGSAAVSEAAPAAPSPDGVAGRLSFTPKSRRINILLVDDHKIMRQGLSSLLQFESDLNIVADAENGEQALELARLHRPDVVIMDVNMPVMNGIDATRILTKEMPLVKVIALSMHQDGDAAGAMRDAGAVAYLTKGGPSEDLVEAIRASCRQRTAES